MLKILCLLLVITVVIQHFFPLQVSAANSVNWWQVQSIDTMKHSRDLARQKLNDQSYDKDIDQQVKLIADTGANFIGIATPYDEEFLPYLRRWVKAARKYELKVWFRGNWSGWEGWFDRPRKMTFAEHIEKSRKFIIDNPELFEDGDSFTACPECENGVAGDPRMTGNVDEYRRFLVDETNETSKAFKQIKKSVTTNWLSMNYDVARLVMDRKTAQAVGGVIAIDHYVKDVKKLVDDVKELRANTGATIFLGEFGAPILDLHGEMTQAEQAAWIKEALTLLVDTPGFLGLNYWVNQDGSTALWNPDYSNRLVVAELTRFFRPTLIEGQVVDQLGRPIDKVKIRDNHRELLSDNGNFKVPVVNEQKLIFEKDGYYTELITIDKSKASQKLKVELIPSRPELWYRLLRWWQQFTS